METAAAFFETRRYASMLGATTEFEKQVRALAAAAASLGPAVAWSASLASQGLCRKPGHMGHRESLVRGAFHRFCVD
jgi:hypothetical protein